MISIFKMNAFNAAHHRIPALQLDIWNALKFQLSILNPYCCDSNFMDLFDDFPV